MAAELPRPGVEVIQVFRSVTPTVVTPTLTPVVVGVCKQIVEVMTSTATGASALNSDARIDLPGMLVAKAAAGSPPAYTSLDGQDLVLSISYGPDVTISFVGTSLSPAAVVAKINDTFATAGVTEAIAELSADETFFVIRTVGVGEFVHIEVKAATETGCVTDFGLIEGYFYFGTTTYGGFIEQIPLLSFPDPRSNLSELTMDPATVRVFLALGASNDLRELSKTMGHLRKGGGGLEASITGSVDVTGLFPGASLDGKVLNIELDGAAAVTVTFVTPKNEVDVVATINLVLGGYYATLSGVYLKITSKTKGADSTVLLSGNACAVLGLSTVEATGTAGVVVVDDGNGDSVSPLVQVYGENFTSAYGKATYIGIGDISAVFATLDTKTLTLSVSGKRPQTLTFVSTGSAASAASQVQAFWPELVASIDSAKYLKLVTTASGEDANIKILGGTALQILGFVPYVDGLVAVDLLDVDAGDITDLNTKKVNVDLNGTEVEVTLAGLVGGNGITEVAAIFNAVPAFAALALAEEKPAGTKKLRIRLLTSTSPNDYIKIVEASSDEGAYMLGFDPTGAAVTAKGSTGTGAPPISGDDFYVDGLYIGRITYTAPGAVVTRLRLDKQLPIDASYGTDYYIIAKNLPGAGRPSPELVVDANGVPTIKNDILRDTLGVPVTSKVNMYLSYQAVRKDVTALAASPSLLRFESTTALEAVLAPTNVLNPLALGLYFALLNAPGAAVAGFGVDEVSASYPYGTVEGFTRAAEALEAYEVYAIAPLTHDETVAEVFNTHVTAMSAPSSKGERICLFNFSAPTKRLDTLITSSLLGNSQGTSGLVFDTGITNLSALLLAKGISTSGTIPTSAGVFLSIAQSSLKYSISGISGSVVTIRITFAAGENDDAFYATTNLKTSPLPSVLIDEPFNVKVRGAALVMPSSTIPDKAGIAETYQALAQSYMNRRFWSVMPSQVAATLDGIEQLIEGFYACAAIAGMIGQQPPQQSFTNFPMTGFTRVVGSNDFFTEKQLNQIAAGGNYIIVQDEAGTPLISRMALTTDMTSLETRTDSITKIVDFTAKFMRRGLRAYIGRFNITQGFLDSLSHVCQGLLGFLTDIGVLIGANLNNIVQDESAPDTVLIDVTLDVPFPCNYIRLTLVV